jgi:hypothetical protein
MRTMNVRKLFKLLLAILVSGGLTIAPFATPAMAEHSMAASTMQMDDMQDMAADMPCCPDQQKNKGCQDCPLVAICMLSLLPAKPPTDAMIIIRLPSHQRLRAFDDVIADGLVRPPPDRPPRSLV